MLAGLMSTISEKRGHQRTNTTEISDATFFFEEQRKSSVDIQRVMTIFYDIFAGKSEGRHILRVRTPRNHIIW